MIVMMASRFTGKIEFEGASARVKEWVHAKRDFSSEVSDFLVNEYRAAIANLAEN